MSAVLQPIVEDIKILVSYARMYYLICVYSNMCIRKKAMSLRLEVKRRPTMAQLLLFQLTTQLVMVLVGSKKVFLLPDIVDRYGKTV